MHSQLKRYLQLNIPFNEAQLSEIIKHFKALSVKKNTLLHSQGETCNKLYYVNKGCIRTYYITEKGDDKSRFIALEGMVVTALSSFISQQPSFEFVAALEDSELLYISHDGFYRLMEEIPEWKEFYLKLLEIAYIYQNKKIEQLVTRSAAERFEILMKEHPEYRQRISNKVLASLLDITQETLSRLKSQ